MLYEPSNPIPEETVEEDFTQRNGSANRFSMPAAPTQKLKEEGVRLIDLDNDEEDRDRDGVRILLTKYSKVFKFLFNKYAMSRA